MATVNKTTPNYCSIYTVLPQYRSCGILACSRLLGGRSRPFLTIHVCQRSNHMLLLRQGKLQDRPPRPPSLAAFGAVQNCPSTADTNNGRKRQNPPAARAAMSVTLHTGFGDIKIEVLCESVPKTAEVSISVRPVPLRRKPADPSPQNFLALCASHYYDASPFHRLIPSFMVQTGAPASPSPPENPKGGRSIWGGNFEDEIRPALKHAQRGTVSMANKGPGTNGSQFFILFDKAPHLDGQNTVFGKVIGDDSMATLAKMEALEVDKKNRPKEQVRIEKITVHANPLAG